MTDGRCAEVNGVGHGDASVDGVVSCVFSVGLKRKSVRNRVRDWENWDEPSLTRVLSEYQKGL